jgi:hypothetical protein
MSTTIGRKRKSAGAVLAELRWANATDEDREQVRENGRKSKGRPRRSERCACGKFTLEYATRWKHQCKAKEEQRAAIE